MRNKINELIFRVDVTKEVGIGHLKRMINFGNQLNVEKKNITWFIKGSREIANSIFNKNNFKNIFYLKNDGKKKIVKFMQTKKINLIFFDLCHKKNMQKKFIQNYINHFKKNGFITVSFEHPNVKTSSNISINPYMFKNKILRKSGKVKLSGHKYFIFSKKISNYLKKRKKIRKDPSNILISLGGTDPKNVAQKLIKLILSLNLNIKLKVLTAFNTKVKHLFKKNKNINFLSYQDDILKHLYWSDIAIINEGNIKFEAAIMGTPSIMINTIEKDNSKLINDFLKFKTLKYVPFQKLNLNFVNNFHKYFANKIERNFHSSNGKKYFNLKGSEEIIKTLQDFR